jgi:hypothetical protein
MAPPFNAMNFGCEEKFDSAERIQQFPLELYHAMNAVKRRDGNAEFDPESLADGLIYDDTYESEFLDDISKDLHPAFVMCLQHLEKLKPSLRITRVCATCYCKRVPALWFPLDATR